MSISWYPISPSKESEVRKDVMIETFTGLFT